MLPPKPLKILKRMNSTLRFGNPPHTITGRSKAGQNCTCENQEGETSTVSEKIRENIYMVCLTFWSILGETLICNSDHIASLISPTCPWPFPTPSLQLQIKHKSFLGNGWRATQESVQRLSITFLS